MIVTRIAYSKRLDVGQYPQPLLRRWMGDPTSAGVQRNIRPTPMNK